MGRTRKTRSYGIGSIYRDGQYFAVQLPESMGWGKKRFKTEAEAKKWQKEQLKISEREERVNTPHATIQEYLSEWLSTRIGIEPTTRNNYERIFKNHVYPTVGPIQLEKFGPTQAARLIATMTANGIGSNTVRLYVKYMRKAMGDAVRRKLIASDPFKGVELPRGKKTPLELPPMEEVQRMLQVARHDQHKYIDVFVILALTTGM